MLEEENQKENKIICKKCLFEKPITDFIKDKSRKSGYHPYCRKCQNKYKSRNSELNIKRANDWNIKNKEKRAIIRKRWVNKNPELIRIYKHIRRDRVSSQNDFTINKNSLKSLQNEFCSICNKKLNWSAKGEIHLDHIIPLSKGGLHSINNVQWTCNKCNLKKGSKNE